MLRSLSAAYFNCAPDALQLATTPQGKPYWQDCPTPLHFNHSHSGDWVFLAFSSSAELGVDVQQIDHNSRLDYMNVARHSLHPQELATLEALPANEQKSTFYQFWACKEAVIKATGQGLHTDLQSFCVTPLPTNNLWLPTANTTLTTLPTDQNHKAALATQTTTPPKIYTHTYPL